MPVPGQETAKSPSELKEIQAPESPSTSDVEIESDKARDGLDASLKKSRLSSLRESSAEIESQVSIQNKDVIRMAEFSHTVDV